MNACHPAANPIRMSGVTWEADYTLQVAFRFEIHEHPAADSPIKCGLVLHPGGNPFCRRDSLPYVLYRERILPFDLDAIPFVNRSQRVIHSGLVDTVSPHRVDVTVNRQMRRLQTFKNLQNPVLRNAAVEPGKPAGVFTFVLTVSGGGTNHVSLLLWEI